MARIFDVRPILCATDLTKSIPYYCEKLGFHVGLRYSDEDGEFLAEDDEREPTFALIGRDDFQLMLVKPMESPLRPGTWLHLDVQTADEVDELFAKWTAAGADIVEPPSVRPWGMYEMRVADLDDNVFRVASPPRA